MTIMRGVTIVTGAGLSVTLARWLGPAGYGRYVYALTMAQFLTMPVLAGLPTLLIRQISIYKSNGGWSEISGLIRWTFGLVSATALTLLIFASVWLRYISVNSDPIYFFALPLVVILSIGQILGAIIQGHERPLSGSMLDGIIRPTLLFALVLLAAAMGNLTPEVAIELNLFAASLAVCWGIWFWRRYCRTIDCRPIAERPVYDARAWFGSLLPLSVVTVATVINSRLDVFLLGILSNSASVAVYGLASQMGGLILMGQTIANTIVAPRIAREYALRHVSEVESLARYAAVLSSVVAGAGFSILLVFGNWIVSGIVGESYEGTAGVALILAAGFVFNAATGPVAVLLSMTGNERLIVRAVAIAALLNTLLNLTLVPSFGATGAALATAAATVATQIILLKYVSNRLGIGPSSDFAEKPPGGLIGNLVDEGRGQLGKERAGSHNSGVFLPDFFIIGAPKCGTTTLYRWLSEHPAVFAPNKEPCFFSQDIYSSAELSTHIPTLEAYCAIFRPPNASYHISGEATPKYLYSDRALREIARLRPDAKLIICLRDPAELVISFHNQKLFEGIEKEPNLEVAWRRAVAPDGSTILSRNPTVEGKINYLFWGGYGQRLEKVYALFPERNIMILTLCEIKSRPAAVYSSVLRFLGVEHDGRIDFSPSNVGYRLKNARLHLIVLAVKRIFEPVVLRLHRLRRGRGLGILKLINRWNTTRGGYDEGITCALRSEIRAVLAEDTVRAEKFLGGRRLIKRG